MLKFKNKVDVLSTISEDDSRATVTKQISVIEKEIHTNSVLINIVIAATFTCFILAGVIFLNHFIG